MKKQKQICRKCMKINKLLKYMKIRDARHWKDDRYLIFGGYLELPAITDADILYIFPILIALTLRF